MLAGLYVAGHLLLGDRVPAGTRVEGVAVGGQTAEEAEATLREELAATAEEPVELLVGDERLTVDPVEAGVSLDVAETVARIGGGRTWDPVQMVRDVVGSQEPEPVVEVDDDLLDAAVADLATEVDEPAREPSVRWEDGDRVVVRPADGRTLDQDATADLLVDALLAERRPLEAPVTAASPTVDDAALETALDGPVATAVGEPVRLVVDGEAVRLPTASVRRALSYEVSDGALEPVLDPEVLDRAVARLAADVVTEPVDATVDLVDREPTIVPGEPGVGVDADDLAASLPAVLASEQQRRLRLPTERTRPEFGRADARALGIVERVSDFDTVYPEAEYRDVNQGRAAELIDGTVLRPGELFSFNGIVGERTEENGFVTGTVIANGVFAEDLGGGVSQVVTTTYNAAFLAGLEDVEHQAHSFYIDRYPMGREATVAWPTIDLKFRNDTEHGVLVNAWVVPSVGRGEGEMHVEMWSTKTWDIESTTGEPYNYRASSTIYDDVPPCVSQSPVEGFDVDVLRDFYRPGESERVRRERTTTVYDAADAVICT